MYGGDGNWGDDQDNSGYGSGAMRQGRRYPPPTSSPYGQHGEGRSGGHGGGRGRGGWSEGGGSRSRDHQSRHFDNTNSDSEADSVMTIDTRKVGRVIGRQGAKIRELQESSGCRIKIDRDNSGPTTLINLEGPPESVQLAKQLIDELTDERQSFNRGPSNDSWRGGRERTYDSGSRGETSEIYVPNNKLGRIIGKGGCKIRELQEDSGCQIQIKKDTATEMETMVALQGSQEARDRAELMIKELTEDSFSSFSR